ncbi:hypothetical protein [Taylorella asinigenitalis]|uniref:Lipoprotein n=1 Tax=Taylorella asinigenitalis (strain MCE3) TaxID=1008459 RepID=G4QCG0_TAYAM|nr:hypothetical protein [Taylorella asinigenitalis]AEP36090.1 hypothetical protein TASI_0307 [Taylorella asinigenitalis MCE3]
MKNILIATVLASAAIISGCASSGNAAIKDVTVEELKETVVKGKTTKYDIRAYYGEPNELTYNDGYEIWVYRYGESTSHVTNFIPVVDMFSSGNDSKGKSIIFEFNKNGTVRNYTISSSTDTSKSGILGKS